MACSQRSDESVFLCAAADDDSLRWECHFHVADQRRRVYFAIHYQPGFVLPLDDQFSRAAGHRRAERGDQSHHWPKAVLPASPLTKGTNPCEQKITKQTEGRTNQNENNSYTFRCRAAPGRRAQRPGRRALR